MRSSDIQSRAASTWTLAFITILLAHFTVDTFSQMIPSSLGLIQERWNLTDRQGAWFLGLGSLCSGLAQPLFAWLSDRTGNRIFGGLGLTIVGLFLSSLGLALSIPHLFAFYVFGMIGNGMFHPIAASTIGQLNPAKRSFSVSYFFLAGMLGGVSGATLGPRLLVLEDGFQILRFFAIPAIILAFLLHRQIRTIEHRNLTVGKDGKRIVEAVHWGSVALLYFSAASRFVVNMGLVYLYVRWTESQLMVQFPDMNKLEISKISAPVIGNLNGASIAGMAAGGFFSGLLIPAGREKIPYMVVPLLCAPLVAWLPHANPAWAYVLVFGAGIGFASLVPVTIALAQRLMPGRTSLASGLMLGGAWSIAMFGPVLAEYLIEAYSIDAAFHSFAALLAISGLFIFPIRQSVISKSVAPTLESPKQTNRG
ncbi:MAG: MFS transporter [Pirellulaceae bacterium]|nr:MFS transporter [Pirellulaceae bacterium]